MGRDEKDPNPTVLERLAALEEDVKWLKSMVNRLDARLWFIVAGVLMSILIQVLAALL